MNIRQHLMRVREDVVNVTIGLLKYWFHVLNKAIFNNQLRTPRRFIIKQHRDVHAWCFDRAGKRFDIAINPDFDCKREFLSILAHEMLHGLEHQLGRKMSHGAFFKSFYWKFKRQGLHLQESY